MLFMIKLIFFAQVTEKFYYFCLSYFAIEWTVIILTARDARRLLAISGQKRKQMPARF